MSSRGSAWRSTWRAAWGTAAILGQQQNYDMIPRLLPIDETVTYAGKSGQDDEKLADAAGVKGAVRVDSRIVTTPGGPYVVAIFARRGRTCDGRSTTKRW